MVITVTGSVIDFTGPKNAKFKGSKYISTKKLQHERAHKSLVVYSKYEKYQLFLYNNCSKHDDNCKSDIDVHLVQN